MRLKSNLMRSVDILSSTETARHSSPVLAAVWANFSMESAFACAKSRKERTWACDSRGPAAYRAATFSGSGEMALLVNILSKNLTFVKLN